MERLNFENMRRVSTIPEEDEGMPSVASTPTRAVVEGAMGALTLMSADKNNNNYVLPPSRSNEALVPMMVNNNFTTPATSNAAARLPPIIRAKKRRLCDNEDDSAQKMEQEFADTKEFAESATEQLREKDRAFEEYKVEMERRIAQLEEHNRILRQEKDEQSITSETQKNALLEEYNHMFEQLKAANRTIADLDDKHGSDGIAAQYYQLAQTLQQKESYLQEVLQRNQALVLKNAELEKQLYGKGDSTAIAPAMENDGGDVKNVDIGTLNAEIARLHKIRGELLKEIDIFQKKLIGFAEKQREISESLKSMTETLTEWITAASKSF